MRIILPYPPSANRYWRTFRGRTVISAAAKAYKARILLGDVKWPPAPFDSAVSIRLCLYPPLTKSGKPSKTCIDLDNCLKVAIDALQGLAYVNDKQVEMIVACKSNADEVGRMVLEIPPQGGLDVEVRPMNGIEF